MNLKERKKGWTKMKTIQTRQAYLVEPGKFEIRNTNLTLDRNFVLIKVLCCGLCNWELNHWKGKIGTFPQIVGHEGVGEVIALGENVTGFEIGDIVTGMAGGFADYAVVPHFQLQKVAKHINPKYAISEPVKCVVTVIRATSPQAGDIGVVVGCGPMGLWCIQALSGCPLSELIAVDTNPQRLELAKKYGASYALNPKEIDVSKEIAKISEGHMADFVIEGTGNAAVLAESMNYMKGNGRGRLLAMSSYENPIDKMDFSVAVAKGIEIIFPHPCYSYDEFEDLRRAVNLINKGVFKTEDFITHVFKLDDIQTAFETLENKPTDYIKGIVIP